MCFFCASGLRRSNELFLNGRDKQVNKDKLAVTYLRAKDSKAIGAQRQALQEYAEREGFRIVCTYADGCEPDNEEKESQLSKLIDDASSSSWKTVLCHDLTRLGRNRPLKQAFQVQKLKEAGVGLHTIAEGEIRAEHFVQLIVDLFRRDACNSQSVMRSERMRIAKRMARERRDGNLTEDNPQNQT